MLRLTSAALSLLAAVLLGGTALAAAGESGGGLHTGQIVAIAIGIALATILVGLSAAYILPKPPKF